MRKKTIAFCFIVGFVGTVISVILYKMATAAALGSTTHAPNMPLLIVSIIFGLPGLILSFIAWIGTLISLARQGRWLWFIVTIFFSFASTLIYLIATPQTADTSNVSSTQR